MRLKISHVTTYSYDSPDHYALLQLRVTPRGGRGQKVIDWTSTITGGTKQVSFNDQFNNHVDLVLVDRDATTVEIRSEGIIETEDNAGVIGPNSGLAPVWMFTASTPATTLGPNLRKLVTQARRIEAENDLDRMHRLSAMILEQVPWRTGSTDSMTTAETALEAGEGVCQDHAHIMIAVARALGYAARYVSGYLLMEDRTEQDASHAWCEVCLDPLGWVGFDVSNGISPDDRYVRVALGLDYADASPIKGHRMGSGNEAMNVHLQVAQEPDQTQGQSGQQAQQQTSS
ncbi:MAG: transglutaminase family protein [Paracoccaceae bacterium]|uniref:transglutaminase family protein n=1 Tax=Seohaeicola saemankumensis TaxID=481181 RepID=UPI001E451D46|nr:transglutaminase family protein [Seohaeicola saemankumensis]MCD1625554.1 transglutaminase family protein [Seohaeicola saemankumensis]